MILTDLIGLTSKRSVFFFWFSCFAIIITYYYCHTIRFRVAHLLRRVCFALFSCFLNFDSWHIDCYFFRSLNSSRLNCSSMYVCVCHKLTCTIEFEYIDTVDQNHFPLISENKLKKTEKKYTAERNINWFGFVENRRTHQWSRETYIYIKKPTNSSIITFFRSVYTTLYDHTPYHEHTCI